VSPGHQVRPISKRDAALVAKLRALCFAFDNHHHGSEHLSVWLPMSPGVQEELVAAEPARFFRPPYVGSAGWVGVVLDRRPDWALISKLLREAFLHRAGARLRAKLERSTPA